ncbi:MAG: AsnC family protein, partial [Bacillota bacterium]
MSGSPVLKDLDVAILSYLKQDGRTPFTFIAQELGVAEGTVRKRVARLI